MSTLFVQSRWTGAKLHALVTQELLPYRADRETRVRIDGPDVMLEPKYGSDDCKSPCVNSQPTRQNTDRCRQRMVTLKSHCPVRQTDGSGCAGPSQAVRLSRRPRIAGSVPALWKKSSENNAGVRCVLIGARKGLPAKLRCPLHTPSTSKMKVGNEAARNLDREIVFLNASTEAEITNAFDEIAKKQVGGLIVSFEGVFVNSPEQIVSLANRYKIPTVYPTRQFTELGGLLSYGPNLLAARRQVGAYVSKILNGTRPADLPVMTPTTYDLTINLKTAKALGLTIPETLIVSADEVIE
jgi:hypothetical protein